MNLERPDHLAAADIAAYLDRSAARSRRDRIEQHLEACPECREELVLVARLVDSAPPATAPGRNRPRRYVSRIAVGVALAAGLAALAIARPGLISPSRRDPVRAPDFSEGRSPLDVVSPVGDSLLTRDGLVLSWRGARVSLYRVTVMTLGGEPVWTTDTPDTAIVVPDTVRLVPGSTYFWRADGIAIGIAASTGAQRLRVGR